MNGHDGGGAGRQGRARDQQEAGPDAVEDDGWLGGEPVRRVAGEGIVQGLEDRPLLPGGGIASAASASSTPAGPAVPGGTPWYLIEASVRRSAAARCAHRATGQ